MSAVLPYIAIVVLIAFSALFSGSEIAFASSSETKLRRMAEEKGAAAKRAYAIFENYDKALISILVGNNLVNIGSSALATVIAISLVGDSGAGIATAVMTVLIIIFGEISPKILASRTPEKFALRVALFIGFIMLITKPIVVMAGALVKAVSGLWSKHVVSDNVTEDDLETIFDTVEEEGVVDEDTADLLQGALEFDDVPVYEIITPRVDMDALDIDDSDEKLLGKILDSAYSRLPVYNETPDDIIGLIHVNQVLRELAEGEGFNLREMMMEAQFVYKTTPLADVLNLMKATKCHLVVVTDEYGGTMGIVTMEDILEQLVGEIFDEKDIIEEEFVELSEDRFEVDGDMRLEDFFYELDMDDEEEELGDDNATIGGWTMEKLEGYPEEGDSFDYKDLHFTVKEAEDMRVLTLEVVKEDLPEESEE